MELLTLVAFATLALSSKDQEVFLRTAEITQCRTIATGTTASLRVTLVDGGGKHDAQVQSVDIEYKEARFLPKAQLYFRDSWRYNVAAYRLSKLLGLSTVPVSVERRAFGNSASVTWWIDDVLMDEAQREREKIAPPNAEHWAKQMETVRVFDQLIHNVDRNTGNLVIARDWKLWMIDHSRAFGALPTVLNPVKINRCERSMYQQLRALDEETLRRELQPYLTRIQIRALLARRDQIVKLLEEHRRKWGDEIVLFELAAETLHATLTN